MSETKIERREFVKKAAYAVPVVLTLKAMPAFAAAGSGKQGIREKNNKFRGDEGKDTPQGRRSGR
jgi:hypothetical protein